jgi:hypothetical protein
VSTSVLEGVELVETESVAVLLVTLPAELLTTTAKVSPSSLEEVAGVV